MAFSQQPVNSTYQTKPISLWNELNSRASSIQKDEYCWNMVPESIMNKMTGDKTLNLIKRAGSNGFTGAYGSGLVRGGFIWKDQQKMYLAIGANVYVFNSDSGALITTLTGIIGAGTTPVGFDEFLFSTGIVKLVVTDGTLLSTIDSANVVVANADADLPVHAPYPVVVDGYLFVLKAGTSDVYNSDNDNPLSWTNGDFITAEMRPDQAIRPARLNNYIIVFGSKSIEYFYDAANATGSPLSRNDSPIKSVGYIGGFAQYGNQIYFVGEMSESESNVFMLEDFKITPVGNEATRRHLSSVSTNSYTNISGSIVSCFGHDLYVMYTGMSTYTMELETKLWGLWGYGAGASFPITFSFQNYGASGYRNIFILDTSSSTYRFDVTSGQDSGTNYNSVILTKNEEFNSYNQKFAHRLSLWGDQQTSSQLVGVQFTDDDYKTYSAVQYLDMSTELPCIRRMGRFRRRAYKFSYNGPLPWRVTSAEIDLNLGSD